MCSFYAEAARPALGAQASCLRVGFADSTYRMLGVPIAGHGHSHG